MSSREKMLKAIRQIKKEDLMLPDWNVTGTENKAQNNVQIFVDTLKGIGGQCLSVNSWQQIEAYVEELMHNSVMVVNGLRNTRSENIQRFKDHSAEQLSDIHSVFLQGSMAVAENGSVWITEKDTVNRLLPFVCERLFLVIEESAIVSNMHQAYERIHIRSDGYGVFIAGPSKTADIEQLLVIGAHGPLNLQVFILNNN